MKRLAVVAAFAAALWLAPGALAAGWCGTGTTAQDRTDIVTGRQVHAIAALPSDAPDTFATVAARLADDTASMTSWWAGQDPTRVPRFDLATFGSTNCLDISFVRLPGASSSYAGASNAYRLISQQLEAAGFVSPYKKYYVYYDGPSVQQDICGTGGGEFDSGPSFAIMWLQGCDGVPYDSVGAHELLHALGALPTGAPHACPGDSGHPCDSNTDVLYPYTTGAPLSAQVLDFNHDDYYAHNGTWIDIQDSLWLHRIDVAPVPLSVTFSGAGGVQSDVPGVDCTQACTTQWDVGSQVALTAEPSDATRFVRWTGACAGSDDCLLQLSQAASVTAVFGPLTIPLRVNVTGKGAVKCTPRCTRVFGAGNRLTLRAVPAKGWKFASWTGGCKSTKPLCRPATDFALSVRALFRRR